MSEIHFWSSMLLFLIHIFFNGQDVGQTEVFRFFFYNLIEVLCCCNCSSINCFLFVYFTLCDRNYVLWAEFYQHQRIGTWKSIQSISLSLEEKVRHRKWSVLRNSSRFLMKKTSLRSKIFDSFFSHRRKPRIFISHILSKFQLFLSFHLIFVSFLR